ncbi:unnamed protein product [Caenorhabditis auriculariae]|uniref:BTB domain-containing protein n=1 Tax=Caenorhabditis auriculariae TaxID=2777116 RepID=A0A8S1HNJ0_9PELO|nr:unnamed protein product [Caenorhabditis auriculariae]
MFFNNHVESLPKIPLFTDDDDDFVKVDYTNKLFHQSYASFNDLRMKCQLCDVVLVAEGRRLSAHKVR